MEADVAHSQEAWDTQGHQKPERATSGNFGRSRAQSAPHFRFLVSKTVKKNFFVFSHQSRYFCNTQNDQEHVYFVNFISSGSDGKDINAMIMNFCLNILYFTCCSVGGQNSRPPAARQALYH